MTEEAEKLISDFDPVILDDSRRTGIETDDDYSISGEMLSEEK